VEVERGRVEKQKERSPEIAETMSGRLVYTVLIHRWFLERGQWGTP